VLTLVAVAAAVLVACTSVGTLVTVTARVEVLDGKAVWVGRGVLVSVLVGRGVLVGLRVDVAVGGTRVGVKVGVNVSVGTGVSVGRSVGVGVAVTARR